MSILVLLVAQPATVSGIHRQILEVSRRPSAVNAIVEGLWRLKAGAGLSTAFEASRASMKKQND